ncbi:hypothetical protein L2E82_05657 [Cichorium intybus]|uniref:Uncharacterized protein n=1 Tax=Cichorium intybus TaxID=13427 RepID=A0ACB9H7W3_CICIN|nr:hypothetical protein L2E82_05657 [Cichorium intybus]
MGFSNFVSDNGIRASQIVRSSAKMTFKSIDIIEKEENIVIDETNDSVPITETTESNFDSQSLEFDLEHHDFTALLFPFGFFSVSFVFVMGVFFVAYSIVHGVIFLLVLNNFCMRHDSFIITFFHGCSLGLARSFNFIIIRWVIRALFTHFLGVWVFGEIADQYTLLRILVRLMFLPFSIFTPWVIDFEKESGDFILTWLISDILLSFILAVDVWVAMADSTQNDREVVKEGFRFQIQVFILQHRVFSFPPLVASLLQSHQATNEAMTVVQATPSIHHQCCRLLQFVPPVGICLVDQYRPLPDSRSVSFILDFLIVVSARK